MLLGILGIQPVFVGEDDQKVGIEEMGHVGAQLVVVAHLYFIRGNGIVFIDNGNDALGQQSIDGIPDIVEAGAIMEVIRREQNLRHRLAALGEQFLVKMHEAHLPHCGAGLFFRQARRPRPVTQGSHAQAHRSRAHQHQRQAFIMQSADFAYQVLEVGLIGSVVVIAQ